MVARLAEAEAELAAERATRMEREAEAKREKKAKQKALQRLRAQKKKDATCEAGEKLRQAEKGRAAEAAAGTSEPTATPGPASTPPEPASAPPQPSSGPPESSSAQAAAPDAAVLEVVAQHADPTSKNALQHASTAARPLEGAKVRLKAVNGRGHEQVPDWLRDVAVKQVVDNGECLGCANAFCATLSLSLSTAFCVQESLCARPSASAAQP